MQRSEYNYGPCDLSWGKMTDDLKRVGLVEQNFSWGQIMSEMGFKKERKEWREGGGKEGRNGILEGLS